MICPKTFDCLPKWLNFAKSGHPDYPWPQDKYFCRSVFCLGSILPKVPLQFLLFKFQHVNRHKLIHSTERYIECAKCKKSFGSEEKLKQQWVFPTSFMRRHLREIDCSSAVFGGRQCNQIWQHFPTLAKLYKYLANFWQLISYLAKCWAYFGKFGKLLGWFSLSQMAKYWKII